MDDKNKTILLEKYNLYKNLFFKDFVDKSMDIQNKQDEIDLSIPFEYITYRKGTPTFGYMGDGTINLAHLTMYFDSLGVDKSKYLNWLDDKIYELILAARDYYCGNPDSPFVKTGFFMRDNVAKSYNNTNFTPMTSLLGLYGENEDVCHSAFVSHDQIWNLLPIYKGGKYLKNILEFLLKHDGVLYNPYESWNYHVATYCNLKCPYPKRIQDRKDNFKMKVKVKRGAFNPQLFYGFIDCARKIYGLKYSSIKSFFFKMLYYTTVFGAEFIYYPLFPKAPVKNNSWHCFYVASGRKGWFGKRMMKKFNKSLKNFDKEPTHYNLAFIYDKLLVDVKALQDWLLKYPIPVTDGNQTTPLVYMTLYNYYLQLIK